jgi:hypothetical protein
MGRTYSPGNNVPYILYREQCRWRALQGAIEGSTLQGTIQVGDLQEKNAGR